MTLTTEDVRAAIRAHHLDIEIRTFEESTATAPEAATAIGTELGSIVKSLCFIVDEQPVVVLTAGDKRVDDRKLGAIYEVGRKKVKIADAASTMEITGYAPGGVPPIGHRTQLPILIDASLNRFEIVFAAAGSARTIFPIPIKTLIEISNGRVVDIVRDDGEPSQT